MLPETFDTKLFFPPQLFNSDIFSLALFLNVDLNTPGHNFVTHKDKVNLLKASGNQISLLHIQYIFWPIKYGTKFIGLLKQDFLNKITDCRPMVEVLLMILLEDLFNTLN